MKAHPIKIAIAIAIASAAVLTLFTLTLHAAPLSKSDTDFFENKVRPILVENCYKCHSSQAEKLKGNLSVEFKESLLKGGENGPAIVPGEA